METKNVDLTIFTAGLPIVDRPLTWGDLHADIRCALNLFVLPQPADRGMNYDVLGPSWDKNRPY